jgi:hypothetical protein
VGSVNQAGENFYLLRDPANRTNCRDFLKYIPLHLSGDYYLTWVVNPVPNSSGLKMKCGAPARRVTVSSRNHPNVDSLRVSAHVQQTGMVRRCSQMEPLVIGSVSDKREFSAVADAYERVMSGKVRFRSVLKI